ncbi:MAG: hypothetical protein EA426_09915 [Spirochaetaceae bacterium]|nr:MAG: hypothetical protein EA426_09915 [Spirochaetaceae bacterium]
MRKLLLGLFVAALLVFVLFVHDTHTEALDNDLHVYYRENFYSDTGAENAVAAIYLNYRMYDTIFEALILLVSIIGMIHFFRAGGPNE